jgi:hypothetical protein
MQLAMAADAKTTESYPSTYHPIGIQVLVTELYVRKSGESAKQDLI